MLDFYFAKSKPKQRIFQLIIDRFVNLAVERRHSFLKLTGSRILNNVTLLE